MNVLKVSLQQSIQVLHARGWSRRRIARELLRCGWSHGLNLDRMLCKRLIPVDGAQAQIEIRGACYHVINRGNYRRNLFAGQGVTDFFGIVDFADLAA